MPDPQRVVLITGCSSGIGRAAALHLAARAWHVVATARDLDAIRDLAGANVDILPLDVTDESARARALEATLARAGRLDALVNNAGFSIPGPLEAVTLDDARAQFETNVWGALRLIQLALPAMRAQGGGRIVNVTSALGKLSTPFSGLYASSKHALEVLSDTLRWELSPWHIHVVVVEPGFVRTSFSTHSNQRRARFEKHPLYAKYLSEYAQQRMRIRTADTTDVVRVLERALTDNPPRTRYVSGWDAWLGIFVRWLLPDALFDWGIERAFGLK